jgi:hypothetical protein
MRALLGLAGIAAASGAPAQGPRPEYEVKTAFLYNFALFTDWPGETDPGVVYCILGDNPFGAALDALNNVRLRGSVASRRLLTPGSPVTGCHVLFIAALDPQGLQRGVQAARGLPVLTVADATGAIEAGVMIALTLERQRVVFEVNLPAAQAAGLNLSSKLLRLARKVH